MRRRNVDDELVTLHREGRSITDIARILGVARSTASSRLKVLGLAPHPRPRRYAFVQFRANTEERAAIQRAADAAGLSVSALIRRELGLGGAR